MGGCRGLTSLSGAAADKIETNMTSPEPDTPGGGAAVRANGADRAAEPAVLLSPRGRRLPPLRRFDDATVAEVQRRVTATAAPLQQIARDTGVSATTVGTWMRDNNWVRPDGAPPPRPVAEIDFAAERKKLKHRLYRALGRQLGMIERRGQETNDGAMTEKDARALGLIARTLDTLSALDRDDGAMRQEPELPDRAELEADLAQRIARWAEGGM